MPSGGARPLQLRDGSRIAVIGGGPAGSFFALHALDLARQRGLGIQVVIFEGKDFGRRGPAGCNKCAGILSSRLLHNLQDLQLSLPPQVVTGEIHTYVLHLGDDAVEINQPDPGRNIASVYRGGGPRLGDLPPTVSFDAWILGMAQQRGAELIRERVSEVRMAAQPIIVTRASTLTCDLVVLATGVNSAKTNLNDLSYVPPVTQVMSQDELALRDLSDNNRVHVYAGHPSGTLFGGVVPKGRFVSVSLLGKKLTKDSVARFLETEHVREMLVSNPKRLCGCNPHVAVSMARNYYCDRFVAIGDAAVTRLYKDGIGAAFLTARQAAWVALGVGVSETDFRRAYAPFCQSIRRDNSIGQMLFAIWERTQRSRRLRQAWVNALTAEQTLPFTEQHCRSALWGMFTGDDSYRVIARRLLSRGATSRLIAGLFRARLRPR